MKQCKQCGKLIKFGLYCDGECREKYNYTRRQAYLNRADHELHGEVLKDQDLVYPDYKEPLRKVKNGFGYIGTVAYTKDRELVQCHICGRGYRSLSSHIFNTHNQTIDAYKERFGLAGSNSLIGNTTKEKLIKTYEKSKRHFLKNGKKNKDKIVAMLVESNKKRKGKKIRLEVRNKRGTCPDQLLDKIRKLYKEKNEVPSVKDFKVKYDKKYIGLIYYYFGSWPKALEMVGLESRKSVLEKEMSNEGLLQGLRNLYEKLGRSPRSSDLKTPKVYITRFGSMNHARIKAGIPIVVETLPRRWTETMNYNLILGSS